MKMYKKEQCEYVNGYIVCDGEIVNVDNSVVGLLNALDTDLQRHRFNKEHEVEAVEVAEFTPKSEHNIVAHVEAKTPKLDEFVGNAIEMMDELDKIEDAKLMNEALAELGPVISFVNDDFIVSCNQDTQERFDLPEVGNPLKLTPQAIVDIVCEIATE